MQFSKEKSKIIVWLVVALISLTSVIAASPNVDVIYITPDDSIVDPGVQVIPNAGTIKEVTITAEVTDSDNVSNIKNVKSTTPFGIITLNKIKDIDSDTANYSNSFNMNFYDAPVTYPIKVTAEDNEGNKAYDAKSFDYLESITLELDSNTINFLNVSAGANSIVAGDNDVLTLNNPTIQNYGNTIIDNEIDGTDLSSGSDNILVSNVQYSFIGENFTNELAGTLNYSSERKNISLYYNVMETNGVSYKLYVPSSTSPGNYNGSITLTAVKGTGNRAPVLHYIEDIIVKEEDLAKIAPNATDLDGDSWIYTFTSPLNSNGEWQTNVGDYGIYISTVTVSDNEFEDSQNVTITVLSAAISKNITLYEGWNLISFPLELNNRSFDYWFNEIDYDAFSYNDSKWFAPTEINNKLGYWLKSNETKNITLIGVEVENKTINLNNGWNLVGYPYLEERNISELYNNVTVFAYNGSWYSYDFDKPFNTLTKFTPGYGYWVKVA